jgi:hypothetical protein
MFSLVTKKWVCPISTPCSPSVVDWISTWIAAIVLDQVAIRHHGGKRLRKSSSGRTLCMRASSGHVTTLPFAPSGVFCLSFHAGTK